MVLYRPWLPGLRAQSLQIVYSAHALAERGHTVRICYRPTGPHPLRPFGLAELPTLQLVPLPRNTALASWSMRLRMQRWRGVFLARDKRLVRDLLRVRPRARVVLEAHEVDSDLAAERGQPEGPWHALEREVLDGVAAVIANCEGVAEGLRRRHGCGATVIHNAGVVHQRVGPGTGVVLAGSLGPGKDLETVARAAPHVGGIDLLGPATPGRLRQLQRLAHHHLRWRGEVPPGQLPERLQRYAVGIVPLGLGLFGTQFTSPLKAFSMLGAGLPFVGADTPALRRATPCFRPYTPGDVDSLVDALQSAVVPCGAPRSWQQRAVEVERVLAGV